MTDLLFIPSERLAALLDEGACGQRLPVVRLLGSLWHSPPFIIPSEWEELEGALPLIWHGEIQQHTVWALVASLPGEEHPNQYMRTIYNVEAVAVIARTAELCGMGQIVEVER